MKKLIFFLLFALPFLADAQAQQGVDSTLLNDTITLKREFFSYLKGSLGDQGGAPYVKFFKKIAEQVDTSFYNPDQMIKFISPAYFTKDCFMNISNQPHRTGNMIIPKIKEALWGQIKNQWLKNQLIQLGYYDAEELKSIIQAGEQYWKDIK